MRMFQLILVMTGLTTCNTVFAEQNPQGEPEGSDRRQRPAMIFQKMDQNEDGKVDRDEFTPARRNMLERMDANNDGAVTLEEMKEGAGKMREQHRQKLEERMAQRDGDSRIEERFGMMDLNKDGSVTAEEARDAMFKHLDQDQDGFISQNEFKPPKGMRRERGDGDKGEKRKPGR